ncbi:MAG TPA: MarR family transcriptional regulator [Streptomyces sp.]|uniref:MarR family winged helix-turn-helix transcriptional regulator n=1 Tax=Streptomyces sp. TaxID=1931 RepID=UPI002BDF7D54|nr:MarR family transcriptional regulator [Streptomyces sp.]HWU07884.1 MarR family transcriptional regulator [Streptomyces sp.]
MLPPPAEVRKRWAAHNPGLDTSPMEVVALVKQINSLVGTAVEPLYDGASLTAPELDLLIPLRYASGPVIARRLADQLQLSRAGISKTLAKLEGRGFIERAPNPADRRAALVTVTPAGAEAVDALFPRQLAVERELLAGLGEDRAKVLEALNLLIRVMEGHLTTASGSRP